MYLPENARRFLYPEALLWRPDLLNLFETRSNLKAIKTTLASLLILIFCNISCETEPELPNGGLFLPDGFEAMIFAKGVGPARHIAVNENGDVYVKLRFAKRKNQGNVALRDKDQDGKADVIKKWGKYVDDGGLANGMEIHDGYLYYCSETKVYRNKLQPGALIPKEQPEIVLIDDHEHGYHWHITKPLSFDNKGKMYVPFGTPSNACMDLRYSPGGTPGIPGLDPCPELEEHGGIWQFDAGKTGLTQRDGRLFATGIRSVVAMDWNPGDGQLYIVMHGRDDLHMLFPKHFSRWQSAVLPAEEFIRVEDGADYGWPYCYYDQLQEKKVLAPEYGGNGEITGRCENMDLPILGFPGHWAPNDLHFYRGDQFPERYRNGAFIAFHGSANRNPYPQAGYFICFVPFENGQPTGQWEVFADGFIQTDTVKSVSDAKFRPMGIAMGPEGALYVTDSRKGRIWKISYTGNKQEFGNEQLVMMNDRRSLPHLKQPHPDHDNLQRDISSNGEILYGTYCGPCHQEDGMGAPGRFPPISGTKWVNGNKEILIGIVLKGMEGKIEVDNEIYNNAMPSQEYLSDEEIATILSYVRSNFKNSSDPISKEDVTKTRMRLEKESIPSL